MSQMQVQYVPGNQKDGFARDAEIHDPLMGQLVPTDDVDALVDLFEQLDKAEREIWTAKVQAQRSLAAKADGEGRVRRVEGVRRRVRIEMPPDTWDQSKLKQLWKGYPTFRERFLRIDAIGVQLREYKKLATSAVPVELDSFKAVLLSAKRPPTGNPRVTIEQ